jgi:hypothetical protein
LRETLILEDLEVANENFREYMNQEIAKTTSGTSIRRWKMNYETLWMGRHLPERKKGPFTME